MSNNVNEIANKKTRKPLAKKEFSLKDFKKKINGEDIPQKPLEWISLGEAWKEQTGLPGIPLGYTTLARGFSNTGKSTLVSIGLVEAQKRGILPIIIDTENNLGRKRLEKMGFDWDNDFYMYIDNDYLLENYGKKQDKNRTEATIEDMANCINDFLDMQENGELPFNLFFGVDSFGTLDCIKTVNAADKGSSDNNMWNAGAFEKAFKYLLNNRIPSSRKINKKYTNTLVCVQKIWIDSMGGGMPAVKHKGGEAAFYGARLIYHFGGTLSHGTKKVKATSKGKEVTFGIETKISVVKNQIDGDLGGIALEGKIISVPTGLISVEKTSIDQYKKDNILYFRNILGEELDADDIGTKVEDVKNEEEFDFDLK